MKINKKNRDELNLPVELFRLNAEHQFEWRELMSIIEQQVEHGGKQEGKISMRFIPTHIQALVGQFASKQLSPRILPTTPGKKAEIDAQIKQKALADLREDTNASTLENFAVKDAITTGAGYLHIGVKKVGEEIIPIVKYFERRAVLFDHQAIHPDGRDAKFVFFAHKIEHEIAERLYGDLPSHHQSFDRNLPEIERALGWANDESVYSDGDGLVDILRGWWKEMQKDGSHKVFYADFILPDLYRATEILPLTKRKPSPFGHNELPVSRFLVDRKSSTGRPLGFAETLLDAQDVIDEILSQMRDSLNDADITVELSNIIGPDGTAAGAFEDKIKLLEEMTKRIGRRVFVVNDISKIRIDSHNDSSGKRIELLNWIANFTEKISPSTRTIQGRSSESSSGVAIQSRQHQSASALSFHSTNYEDFIRRNGRLMLSTLEQYIQPKKLYVAIDAAAQISQIDPEQLAKDYEFDDGTYRFDQNSAQYKIISANSDQSELAELSSNLSKVAQVSGGNPAMQSLLLAYSIRLNPHLPQKEEIAESILLQAIELQQPIPPSALPPHLREKAEQIAQSRSQSQQQQQQVAEQRHNAETEKIVAQSKQANANAFKLIADAMNTFEISDQQPGEIDALKSALEKAQSALKQSDSSLNQTQEQLLRAIQPQ